jgi:hypothetical protein
MADHLAFLPVGFETLEQAKGRREQLVGWLRAVGRFPALAIAHRLEACEPDARCRRDTCAVCKRIWRKQVLREVDELLGDERHILRASIVCRGGRVEPGELARFDLRRFVRSRQRALQRALPNGIVAFGGIDISWNTEENDGGHWQVHIYVLVFAPDSGDLRDRIRAAFPAEPTAKRPYRLDVIPPSDLARVASYAIKADLYWRSGFLAPDGRHDTNPLPLKREQAVEAALFRDRHPIGGRLLLKGLKRYRTSDGWIIRREK